MGRLTLGIAVKILSTPVNRRNQHKVTQNHAEGVGEQTNCQNHSVPSHEVLKESGFMKCRQSFGPKE